jgi:hypothetical protein
MWGGLGVYPFPDNVVEQEALDEDFDRLDLSSAAFVEKVRA